MNQQATSRVGIIGRTLRFMISILFGWMAFTTMRLENTSFNLRILAVSIAIATLYAVLHIVLGSRGTTVNRWSGAVVAVAPVILLFVLGGPLVQAAVLIYVGVSLLLQTVRADGNCEVLAIQSAVIKPPTHLAGILFAPIDLVERHLSGPGGLPG